MAALRLPTASIGEPGQPPALTDDDGGAPLFAATNMKPGDVRTECVQVTVEDGAPAMVGVAASATGTGLDEQLDVVIEAGVGGRFGDCSGFTGSPVYQGTVADLVSRHPDAAALDAWSAASDGERRTFRVQVRLRDDAQVQGQSTIAQLAWHARSITDHTPAPAPPVATATPAPSPPAPSATPQPTSPTPPPASPVPAPAGPAPTAVPTADPEPTPHPQPTADDADDDATPGGSEPGRTAEPTKGTGAPGPVTPAAPAALPPPSSQEELTETAGALLAGSTRGRRGGSRGARQAASQRSATDRPFRGARKGGDAGAAAKSSRGRRPSSLAARAREAISKAARAAVRLAEPAAERAAFPAFLMVLVGLFALLQNRIDARDPKLALAPVHRSPDLLFQPFPREQESYR